MSLNARKIRLVMHLRHAGVMDSAVLGALEKVPRDLFVPAAFGDQAYEDLALPIGLGQTISQPLIVAKMTEALEISKRHKVLEIGTGSGYQAAILAQLCRRLYTIERHKDLLRDAEARFAKLRIGNITTMLGDGTKGWDKQAPFDRIMVTAAGGLEPPPALLEQMAVGGVMIIPLAVTDENSDDQVLVRIRRHEDGWEAEELDPVRFVPLVGDGDESRRGRDG
jgi:protein-L-isoaspartate(D-aspartate) O-methyltransferase